MDKTPRGAIGPELLGRLLQEHGRDLGFAFMLPELSRMRTLAIALSLRTRLQMADGRLDETLRSLQTGMSMVRQVAAGPTIVEQLVAIGIARFAFNRIEELTQLRDSPNMYWALANLPRPLVDPREAIRNELVTLFSEFSELRDLRRAQHSPEQWDALAARFVGHVQTASGGKPAVEAANRQLAAGWTKAVFPVAEKYLVSRGTPRQRVAAMPPSQAVLIYFDESFREYFDQGAKWLGLPYWQGKTSIHAYWKRDVQSFAEGRVNPLLLQFGAPAASKVWIHANWTDRHIAALQCIEAIRLHAAAHGKLPASLADITGVPLPLDPMTGTAFPYTLADGVAVLDLLPEPDWPLKDATRYELRLAK